MHTDEIQKLPENKFDNFKEEFKEVFDRIGSVSEKSD